MTDWPGMWRVFDIGWDGTCGYHQKQATSIFNAVDTGLFAVEEGMMELRYIMAERERCAECR